MPWKWNEHGSICHLTSSMAHNTMNKRELYYGNSGHMLAMLLLCCSTMRWTSSQGRKEGEGDSVSAAVAVVTTGRAMHAG
jgi:hypothetical protein